MFHGSLGYPIRVAAMIEGMLSFCKTFASLCIMGGAFGSVFGFCLLYRLAIALLCTDLIMTIVSVQNSVSSLVVGYIGLK
jgi:hypothetical protein